MAGAKKSKRIEKPDSEVESEEEEEEECIGQEIQATFEGRNLEGHDFHGIKQLLQQLFVTAHMDLTQVCDILIAQAGVGSVLKQSCNESDDEDDVEMVEETDVFGVTTVLNLPDNKSKPCVLQLLDFLNTGMSKCSKDLTEFKNILSTKKVGLLINERFLNIPSKISHPMLSSLHEEITRMKKKHESYHFDYYLMVCKMWRENDSLSMIFSNDEEEIFFKKSDTNFAYSLLGKVDTGLTGKWESEDKQLAPYRIVLLFKSDKFPEILSEIQESVM